MAYNIHTYKDILETLKLIEQEDSQLRNQKSFYVCAGGVAGLLVVLVLCYFSKLTYCELITSFGATIAIGPVFGFVYYSTQADLLSQRKQQFWQSLIQNFGVNYIIPYNNVSVDENELRKVLMEKINEKINEALKYEQ